jgi:hypothetical protein
MSFGMKSDSMSMSQVSTRLLVALMLTFTFLATEKSSVSASTQIFYEPFTQGWTAGTTWSLATGANYTAQIWTEATQTPQYALRLTSSGTSRSGGLIYNRPIPTSSGLDVSFTFSMWGGTGADGMNFFLLKHLLFSLKEEHSVTAPIVTHLLKPMVSKMLCWALVLTCTATIVSQRLAEPVVQLLQCALRLPMLS